MQQPMETSLPCPACALQGCEVTFVEALPNIMPGFDKEIAKLAQRLLINSRPIDFHTNVIASKVTPGACAAALSACWGWSGMAGNAGVG
mgnify:CR=1 FL=1